MNKGTRNYFVDSVIGTSFLITALSALVFLIPTSWIDFSTSTTPTFLWLNFGIWQTLHTWGGIAMLVGVVIHQLLHWNWIKAMTTKVLKPIQLPRLKRSEASQARTSQTP